MTNIKLTMGVLFLTLNAIFSNAQSVKKIDLLYIDTITISNPYLIVFDDSDPGDGYRYIIVPDSILHKLKKKDFTYEYVIKHYGYEYEPPSFIGDRFLKQRLNNWTLELEEVINKIDSLCTTKGAQTKELLTSDIEKPKPKKSVGIFKVNCSTFLLFYIKSDYLLKHWQSSHIESGVYDSPNLFVPLVVPIIEGVR